MLNSLDRILAIAAMAFALASVSHAQQILLGTIEPDPAGGATLKAIFGGPPRSLAREVLGAPYSAEHVRREIQTLADGPKITRDFPSVWMFRDSQGRRRMESSILTGPNGEPGIDVIEIRDFAAGYEYTLDPASRIAHRMKLPPDVTHAQVRNGAVATIDPPLPSVDAAYVKDRERTTSQPLGTRTIEGSLADGTMTTTTIPAGLQGHDRPLIQKTVTWIAQDLNVILLSSKFDGGSTIITSKLVNIKRDEPDPSLFRVPVDYRIIDEEDRFTIERHRAAAPSQSASPEDERAVRKVLADFADARNAFNAAAMAEAYADSAVLGGTNLVEGRAAIGAMWARALASRDGQAARTIKTIRFPRPDVALVLMDVVWQGNNGSNTFQEHYQLVKNTGHWQIRFQKTVEAGDPDSN
jgi:ketosteroid isomerase-like protein